MHSDEMVGQSDIRDGQDWRENMKKYDLMWLIVIIGYIVAAAALGYFCICTVLAMLQHGDQAWNIWQIIARWGA